MAQLTAKIVQDSPPKTSICGQNAIVTLIFTLRPFLQRSPPRRPKMPKITPQSATRWPDKPHLGPSWPHLGAKFGHLAAILGIPRLSKIGPNRPRQPPGHFFVSRSPPRAPRPPPDLDFSSFRAHSFNNFRKFSNYIFIDSALKLNNFFNIFSLIFFGGVPLQRSRREERGRRYSPQASSITKTEDER